MKFTLAFVNSTPGHGLIRVRVNDARAVTVGRYDRQADGEKWTASLYAAPGRNPAIAAEITSVSVDRLSTAVGKRLAQGMWWK